MLGAILAFLGASLLLYVLFAGADFGAGVLELFAGKSDAQRKLVSRAMAPVWEANHVWLVLVVVILFMGFPAVYTTMATHLWIPEVAVLVGIVARGTAFTFRHYDTLTTRWYAAYSRVFALSSLWTAAWLGALAGALVLGRVDPTATDTWGLYVAPWANAFAGAMAVFTVALFSLLAAVFLVGEAEDPELGSVFQKRARVSAVVVVVAGAGVFGMAEALGLDLVGDFFRKPASIAAFAMATALLVPFWRSLGRGPTTPRALGAAIVACVLFGWFAVQYPVAVRLAHGAITFPEAAAPPATQAALLGALIVGSVLIFPSLGWLFYVFKWSTFERERA